MCVCAHTRVAMLGSVSHLFLYFRLKFVPPCCTVCGCLCVFVYLSVCAERCMFVSKELCDLSMMARLNKDTHVFLSSSYLATLFRSLTRPTQVFCSVPIFLFRGLGVIYSIRKCVFASSVEFRRCPGLFGQLWCSN